MIFVVRAGHALHVSKIRGQYCLTSSTVKEAHQFRSVKGADKVAAYFRRHHGVYAVVDEGTTSVRQPATPRISGPM